MFLGRGMREMDYMMRNDLIKELGDIQKWLEKRFIEGMQTMTKENVKELKEKLNEIEDKISSIR